MSRRKRKEFITIDPEDHHDESGIKGLREPGSLLIGSIADGVTVDEITQAAAQVTERAVRAALAYAEEVLCHDISVRLAA